MYITASADVGKSRRTLDNRVQACASFNMCTCTSANSAGVSHYAVRPVLSVSPLWCAMGPPGRCRPGVSCGSVVVCPDAHGFVR